MTTDFDAKARTWDDDPQKVERARQVADAIAAQIPDLARMKVLEYGAGTGLLGFALQPRVASITMADASREMIAVAREKIAASGARNVTAIDLDLLSDPPPATRYDLVCTLLTLHHIPDTEAILRRLYEVTSAPGLVCISDLDEEDGSFHGAGVNVHRGFRRDALAARMLDAGFRNVRFSTAATIAKQTPLGVQFFPVFLAIAERPAEGTTAGEGKR